LTGWIIFGIIVAILAAPFFVPLTLRVGLDERRRDWSVHVGTLQVAPDGEVHFKAFRERWAKRLRPLKTAIRWLWTGIVWVFKALIILLRIVFWPFTALFRLVKGRGKTGPADETLSFDTGYEEPAGESGLPEHIEPLEEDKSGEIRRDASEGFDSSIDEPLEPEPSEPAPEEPDTQTSEDSSVWERMEPLDEETPAAEEQTGPSAFSKAWKNLEKGLKYLEIYGPMAKKVLRAVTMFIGDCFRAIHFKRLDAQYGFGGDPAALGTLLGWHYAFVSAINPSLVQKIRFEPDFDEEEAPIWGTLDTVVVIWPYRFIPPIFALIARLPWLGIFRTVRAYQRGDGLIPETATPSSTGVAA